MGTAVPKQYFCLWACWACHQPYTAVEPCKPMRIFYLEEVENADMDIVVQQSSRLWNDNTDWPIYNKAKEEYYVSSAILPMYQ